MVPMCVSFPLFVVEAEVSGKLIFIGIYLSGITGKVKGVLG